MDRPVATTLGFFFQKYSGGLCFPTGLTIQPNFMKQNSGDYAAEQHPQLPNDDSEIFRNGALRKRNHPYFPADFVSWGFIQEMVRPQHPLCMFPPSSLIN
jgi:hypothetical protein